MNFSFKNREHYIRELKNLQFDLLVIGGGITGAGIALDATSRGLKVALIDMQDFAAGTSSRSTKLIHGGLRYLKQLEFKLVAEVGKERKIIHRIAPHLTRPEQMLLPLLKNGSFSKFSARLGMWIYERMAGVSKKEWHKFLSIEKSLVTEPLLNKKNLIGSIVFYEYRTDDARLTIEVIKESVARGVIALNYLKVVSFIYDKKIVRGVEVIDQLNDEKFIMHAKHIINASGPWVDELSILENNNAKNKLQITKGVHLVVDWKKLPVKQSLYFDAFDKRMLFIIPRDGKTYIGTTDTFYKENKINPIITEEDRNYILKCVNDFFPQTNLKISDIESAWAGLRPLISKPSKGPSEISRKDEMFESDSGMLTIAGGKLTGYRKMAERIVDKVAKKIYLQDGIKIQKCITHHIELSGGKLNGYENFSEFIKDLSQKGILLGLSIGDAETLIYRYGSNVLEIYRIIEELKNEQNELPIVIRAQIRYAIEYEMCANVTDFLIRRTGSLYFNFEVVKIYANSIFKYMQSILNLNESAYHKFESEWHDAILEIENIKK
ncbi:MAG: glycerol-3-phosphate dehydrogenase/oxidase [Bacteroidota bacterium]